MDPLTQGLIGAVGASCFAKKREKIKISAICGALGGLTPDLDILIRSSNDPLLSIEYHRHFTHSLAFIPFGGLFVAAILYLCFFRGKEKFRHIYLYATIGFATHGLLDACTSYGTQLYWPFSDYRVAWNIISIIDPIFTITLLVFMSLGLVRRSKILIYIGLTLALSYLAFCVIKHVQVENFIKEIANKRNHKIERILLNPTIGNNILWRSIYKYNDYYYIDAVYMPAFAEPIIQEGTKVQYINKETVFPSLGSNSVQREDIKRFAHFADNYIYLHKDYDNMIADLRYGTLPYDDKSLWGIKIDTNNPQNHVTFGNIRKISDKQYDEFWLMLNGQFTEE